MSTRKFLASRVFSCVGMFGQMAADESLTRQRVPPLDWRDAPIEAPRSREKKIIQVAHVGNRDPVYWVKNTDVIEEPTHPRIDVGARSLAQRTAAARLFVPRCRILRRARA